MQAPQQPSADPQGKIRSATATRGPAVRLGPGARIGEFRIEGLLGRGTFATVFAAADLRVGTPCALKVPHGDGSGPALIDREAVLTAELDDPHLVRLRRADSALPPEWLALEWIPGRSLAHALRAGARLDTAALVDLARQAAHGLEALAQRGIVHRDVKPSNLMLGPGGHVTVIDLGLAERADEPASSEAGQRPLVCGTPVYMAPEQVGRGRVVDARADMYALGATLFHAACGRPPFTGGSARELARAKCEQFVPRPSAALPDFPEPLEALLIDLLAPRPAHRPATWSELRAALEDAAEACGIGRQVREPGRDGRASGGQRLAA